MHESAASRYYLSLLGAWRGSFTFELTSRAALRASKASKFAIEWMGTMSRLTGASVMSTTLTKANESGRSFNHTTRVAKWGVTVFSSAEVIEVADDGRSLHMSGEQGYGPFGNTPYACPGTIDEASTGAEYVIPWLGTTMVQRTRILDEGRTLELTQKTDFSFARVLLLRQPSAAS